MDNYVVITALIKMHLNEQIYDYSIMRTLELIRIY